jgi:hypothetical protein
VQPAGYGPPGAYSRPVSLPWTSARLAAWTVAFFEGAVGPDDATDAVTLGAVHRVAGLDDVTASLDAGPGPDADGPIGLSLALGSLRAAGGRRAWLLWPVPGDLHGLTGPAATNKVVVEAGQAVLVEFDAGSPARVLVPSRLGSSGVLWNALPAETPAGGRSSLAEADRSLKETVRTSVEALDALDVARAPADGTDLDGLRRRTPELVPPPGFPNRARVLLDTAQRLVAVARLARTDDGAALNARESVRRVDVLRDVERVARHAFVAAVNARAEELARSR